MSQIVLAVIGVLVGICLVTALAIRVLWAYTWWGPKHLELIARRCEFCQGAGVQMLRENNRGQTVWTSIPAALLITQKDGLGWGTFEAPVGNQRECTHCNGKGYRWFDADSFRLPPR